MQFEKWFKESEKGHKMHPNIENIGKVVVFYIPKKKHRIVKDKLQDFFISHFNAFTITPAHFIGYWRKNSDSKIIKDDNVRYEVALKSKQIKKFFDFLSEICSLINEDSIYITVGSEAWLITSNNTKNKSKKN